MATRGGEAAGEGTGEGGAGGGCAQSAWAINWPHSLHAPVDVVVVLLIAFNMRRVQRPPLAPPAHEVWPQGAGTQSTLLAICRPRRLHWEHKHVRCGGTCCPAPPLPHPTPSITSTAPPFLFYCPAKQ